MYQTPLHWNATAINRNLQRKRPEFIMVNKEIWLKIQNDKVWFNNTDFIDIRQSDIPAEHLTFAPYKAIWWKVKMHSFDKSSGKLDVEIMDYDGEVNADFYSQKPKFEIKFLSFGTFNWKRLSPLLSAYHRIKFIHLLTDVHEPLPEFTQPKKKDTVRVQITEPDDVRTDKGGIRQYEETFTVDFNECVFSSGCVCFSKYVIKADIIIDFAIVNDNILPEFDTIKYWFSKKLKTKKFSVDAKITMDDDELREASAWSKDISKIDRDFIDGVKVQRTLQITKTIRPPDIDKALFTSDELYTSDYTDDATGNVFRQSEKDILSIIMEKSNVRNKRELMYLSGSKHSPSYRIRFTNHPHFGFIFLAEGESNHHFIWELLNSHATYIWSMPKGYHTPDWQYNRMEAIINTILAQGRDTYKRAYMTSNRDDALIFNVIHHTDKGSDFIDGFPKWKHRINALLT